MPEYTYECAICGKQQEAARKIADRHISPICCNGPTDLIISCRRVIADLEPHYDVNLETYVKSRQHRKQVMREKDVYDKRDFKGHKWRNSTYRAPKEQA